jgi:hypothetical protein
MKDTHERLVYALVERSMALASEFLSFERTPSRRIEWPENWIVIPDGRATTSVAFIGLALRGLDHECPLWHFGLLGNGWTEEP